MTMTAIGCYSDAYLPGCLCSWSRAVTVYLWQLLSQLLCEWMVSCYYCSTHSWTRSLYHTCGLLSHSWLEAGSPTAASTWRTCMLPKSESAIYTCRWGIPGISAGTTMTRTGWPASPSSKHDLDMNILYNTNTRDLSIAQVRYLFDIICHGC